MCKGLKAVALLYAIADCCCVFITDGFHAEKGRNMSDCKWTVRFLQADEEQPYRSTEINASFVDQLPAVFKGWTCEHGHPVFVWQTNDLVAIHGPSDL